MATDTQVIALIDAAFAGVELPEHFTRCCECAERGEAPRRHCKDNRVRQFVAALVWTAAAVSGFAQEVAGDRELGHSVEQLRSSIGAWEVKTDFLNPDGSVAKSVRGTYEFSWIVRDRVVAGRSDIPELKQAAGLLFYVDEAGRKIEMASVGADGKLWIMAGPLGSEERRSQEFKTSGGGVGRLRFRRFNVSADAFESRMDYTEDGGTTWTAGNHQHFRRLGRAVP